MDRYVPPSLGRRRGWMLITQILLLITMGLMGSFSPQDTFWPIVYLSIAIAFLSASQDIVLDAFRREILPDRELGLGNSIHVNAYRIAGLIPGSLALILADHLSWFWVYWSVAIFMLPGLLMTLLVREPKVNTPPPASLKQAVIEPFHEFFPDSAGDRPSGFSPSCSSTNSATTWPQRCPRRSILTWVLISQKSGSLPKMPRSGP